MGLNAMCWVILASSSVVGLVAVAGMVSKRFDDTFLQCLSLAAVSIGGFIVTLQIYEHGIVQISGIAFQSLSVAFYAVVTFIKYATRPVCKEYVTTSKIQEIENSVTTPST